MRRDKLTWYLNRLTNMSPVEMLHRLWRSLTILAQDRGGWRHAAVPAPQRVDSAAHIVSAGGEIQAAAYVAEAEQILQGRIKVLNKTLSLSQPVDWRRNCLTGEQPPDVFGKKLDYRDTAAVGDIKYVWVQNRHAHLVTLAQAYVLTADEKYLAVIRQHLHSWFAQNRNFAGPNWTSSLELAIRLINWSLVWTLLGGWDSRLFDDATGAALRRDWLDMIYRHARFIRGYFSRFSSANNHLLGEAAGLYVACAIWPCWRDFAGWRRTARRILEQEITKQVWDDGVGKEQSLFYQIFVLDFLLVAGLAARRGAEDFSAGYWRRVETMLEFLASLCNQRHTVPMIGDSDDGYFLLLSQSRDDRPLQCMLNIGAVLFSRADLAAVYGQRDDKSQWLLGADAARFYRNLDPQAEKFRIRTAFPQGGYYILGKDFGSSGEVKIVADAGPLGYLAIAAHGHADALSLVMSVGGEEILIDPGTYVYQTQKEWRNYFRGTAAHNTLSVDGCDQSQIGGNFMWTKKAETRCLEWHSDALADRLVAEHDGYRRLPDPVGHRRRMDFDKHTNLLRITDRLDCAGQHHVVRCWHFAEACAVVLDEAGALVTSGGVSLRISAAGGRDTRWRLYRASEEPKAGWVSRKFNEKEAIYSLWMEDEIQGSAELMTSFAITLRPEIP